jgi:hypothetical protein
LIYYRSVIFDLRRSFTKLALSGILLLKPTAKGFWCAVGGEITSRLPVMYETKRYAVRKEKPGCLDASAFPMMGV